MLSHTQESSAPDHPFSSTKCHVIITLVWVLVLTFILVVSASSDPLYCHTSSSAYPVCGSSTCPQRESDRLVSIRLSRLALRHGVVATCYVIGFSVVSSTWP